MHASAATTEVETLNTSSQANILTSHGQNSEGNTSGLGITISVFENTGNVSTNGSSFPCFNFMSCDRYHQNLSCSIMVMGIIAFLENLVLVLAMNKWNLKKVCKMYWFLWHLALADVILAATYICFHARILSSCPVPYSCQPTYQEETFALSILFYGSIIASHLFVIAATFDRFIAIKWSFQYNSLMSTKVARVVAGIIWSLSFSIPIAGVVSAVITKSDKTNFAIIAMTSSVCLICAACVIGMNIWMVTFAWTAIKKSPSLRSIEYREPNTVTVDSQLFHDRLKLAITLSLFVCSFVLSCAPWSIKLVVCDDMTQCALKRDEDYTLVLVLLHGILIPLLYGFRVRAVKVCVKTYWKKLLITFACKSCTMR